MPPSGTVPRDYMGEALERYDQRLDLVNAQKQCIGSLEANPCPPDPELEDMFKAFADYMRDSGQEPVPLVIEGEEKHGPNNDQEEGDQKKHKTGNFLSRIIGRNIAGWQMGREGRVLPRISDIEKRRIDNLSYTRYFMQEIPDEEGEEGKVLMGWPIRAKHLSGIIRHSHQSHDLIGSWAGLVVDTHGRLWLARDSRKIAPDGLSWDGYQTEMEVEEVEELENGEIVRKKVRKPAPVTVEGDLSEYMLYENETPLGANILEYLSADAKTGVFELKLPGKDDEGMRANVEEVAYKRREPRLGHLRGRSLRETIIWYCGISNTSADDIPEKLAEEMARMIRKAEIEREAKSYNERLKTIDQAG